jgi:LAO/AO transport system kinase
MVDPGMTTAALVNGLKARDRKALARAISLVENRLGGFRELLAGVHSDTGTAFRLGITGPPGAGKSTLVDALASHWAQSGKRVGIVAVDPTSPFTGGALLGDRVRMGKLSEYPEVYIRSMATRGSMGGVAAATRDAASVMDAYGFDWLLVETVGVGQIEIEVMNVCDAVCVVFVPESGDGVQALKAGLIEVAQIFVVNKADRPGAPQLASELESVLHLKQQTGGWDFPVLTTEAVNHRGTTELADTVERLKIHLETHGRLNQVRQRQALSHLENILRERLHLYLSGQSDLGRQWTEFTEQIVAGDLDPHRGADLIWERLVQSDLPLAPGDR